MHASTLTTQSPDMRTAGEWVEAIAETYFPMDITFKEEPGEAFKGIITGRPLGETIISALNSSPLCYKRFNSHSAREDTDYFLVTMPQTGDVYFQQNGRRIECQPGDFLIEYSAEPYIFGHNSKAFMTAFRVPSNILRSRVNSPEDYCAVRFSRSEPGVALFLEFFQSIYQQMGNFGGAFDNLTYDPNTKLSSQLVDLLALAIDSRWQASSSVESSTQQAHLHRIFRYINKNLNNPNITVEEIAAKNGLSVRYLHQLFEQTGNTVAAWIRNRRLDECHQELSDTSKPKPKISELAYKWGFSDQASFSRCFKAKYSMTPREVFNQAQSRRS